MLTADYAEGAFSQVLFQGGVWWHWRRPCKLLGAWIPVAGRGEPREFAHVPRVTDRMRATREAA